MYHFHFVFFLLRPQEFSDDTATSDAGASASGGQSPDLREGSCDSDDDLFVNTNRQTSTVMEFSSSDTDD